MLFNSSQFLIFFVIFYGLYLASNFRRQNRLLLAASVIFYAFWSWRFLILLLGSTFIDYYCALKMSETSNRGRRKIFLAVGIAANLLILGFFKYFNFFISNMQNLLNKAGFSVEPVFLDIILPLGISFYTFKAMSYLIDVYRENLKAVNDPFYFATYIMFFPQLIAGPIERAPHFFPQIEKPRKIGLSNIYGGAYLIFWGLFQKVVVADNLARLVAPAFAVQPSYNGAVVLLASYAFTIQLFCDFAGYSNMANGLGVLMGFEPVINFNMPFFATNVQEFWNRWHITLSSWVKDYIYIPLYLSMRKIGASLKLYIAIFITMTVLGLWHGAAWKYVIFGVYWGILLIAYAAFRQRFSKLINPESVPTRKAWFCVRVIFMFNVIALGMLIFRAQSLSQAYDMASSVLFNFRISSGLGLKEMLYSFLGVSWFLLIIEFLQFKKSDLMAVLKLPVLLRGLIYFIIYYMFVTYGVEGGKEFIYFKF